MRLRAARSLSRRVSLRRIVREKTPIALANDEMTEEVMDPTEWFNELAASPFVDEVAQDIGLHKDHFLYAVKNLWELECMVRALDAIETLASMAHLMRTYVIPIRLVTCSELTLCRENAGGKDFTLEVSRETRYLKGFMKPVIKEWLTTGLGTSYGQR
jgi:nuclear pore complex protein Nup107